MLGAIVGFAGLLEGKAVEGFMDGLNGICEGFTVDLKVGIGEDGLCEGLTLGAEVGLKVGQSDVLAVGICVGFTVVSRVGFPAGFADGVDVRVTVGTEVDFLDGNTLKIGDEVGG